MTYSQTILAESGLVSYWRLGEPSGTSAADSKDSNPGTYTGGFTLGSTPLLGGGDPAKSVSLNGTTGFVSVPDAANLRIIGALTLEVWLDLTADFSDYWILAFKGSGGFAGPYGWFLNKSTGIPQFKSGNGTTQTTIPALGAPAQNKAQYLAVTLDGSGNVAHYGNGNPNGTGSMGAQAITDLGTALLLGHQPGTAPLDLYWPGNLQEFAVYNVALSSAQIQAHYLAGLGLALPSPAFLPRNTIGRGVRNRGQMSLFLQRRPQPASQASPQTFFQSLLAIASSSPALVNQTGKGLAASSTGTAFVSNAVGKLLTAISTGSGTLIRSVGHIIAVTSTGTASLTRQVLKPLSTSSTATAAVVKRAAKTLAATSVGVATLAVMKVILKTLTATATGTAVLTRSVGKGIVAASTGTPALVRQVAHTLAALSVGSPNVVNRISKTLAASSVGIAALTATKVILKTLAVTATGTAVLTKSTLRTLVTASTGLPSVIRQTGKGLAGTSVGVASVAKRVGKTFAATSLGTAILQTLKTLFGAPTATYPVAADRALTAMAIADVATVAIYGVDRGLTPIVGTDVLI